MGDIEFYRENYSKAEKYYLSIQSLLPSINDDFLDYASKFSLAAVKGSLGFHKESFDMYNKLTEVKPDYPDAWNNRGVALIRLGRFDEALKSYDKAIELQPDHADAWQGRGTTLERLGRLDEALKSYDKAIELTPCLKLALLP